MNKQEQTKEYYNSIAKGYPELYHQEQINKINKIKHLLPKKGKVLDAGAGAGVLNQFLNKEIELISFDLSEELLNLNSNKKEKKIQGTLTKTPFQNQEFDSIISLSVIQDIEETKELFLELIRILKPNSKAIISHIKFSKKSQKIKEEIEKYFEINQIIEEEKDLIYILNKKEN